MLKTIKVTTEITPDRELCVAQPPDTPLGPADVVVIVSLATPRPERTVGALLNSEFFAMWRDRDDIADSAEFARQLRDEAWSRPR